MDREVRLQRVRARQHEFWTRKLAKNILGDMMEDVFKFRSTHTINMILENMLEEVTELAMVNNLFMEVMKAGQGPVAKLERRCQNRFDEMVEEVMKRVVEDVARKSRRLVHEQRKVEWQHR